MVAVAADIRLALPYRYAPRPYQWPKWRAMHEGVRFFCDVEHRRAGKDDDWFNIMVDQACSVRPGNYFYFFPTYTQGQKALWEVIDNDGLRIIDHLPPELLLAEPTRGDMLIRLRSLAGDGTTLASTIQVLGFQDVDSVLGTNPVGIVVSEAGVIAQDGPLRKKLGYLLPILAANHGWLALNGTPRGDNDFKKIFDGARRSPRWWTNPTPSGVLTIDDTADHAGRPLLTREEVEADSEILGEELSDELIRQEYYCDWLATNAGTYYGRAMERAEAEGRVTDVPHDPALPVDTMWDLGTADPTAIAYVQIHPSGKWAFIEYDEATGEGLAYYARTLREKPYVYGRHYLPPDAAVRELGSGETRVETLKALGIAPTVIAPHEVADGIERVRVILAKAWFDARKTERLRHALRAYGAEFDPKRDTFRSYPRHDWASHGSDAVRTGAMGYRPPKPATKQPRPYRPRYLR